MYCHSISVVGRNTIVDNSVAARVWWRHHSVADWQQGFFLFLLTHYVKLSAMRTYIQPFLKTELALLQREKDNSRGKLCMVTQAKSVTVTEKRRRTSCVSYCAVMFNVMRKSREKQFLVILQWFYMFWGISYVRFPLYKDLVEAIFSSSPLQVAEPQWDPLCRFKSFFCWQPLPQQLLWTNLQRL